MFFSLGEHKGGFLTAFFVCKTLIYSVVLVVPKNTKAVKVADKDAIGVFALDSGRVVKKLNAQNVPVSHRLELMKEAFFRHNMKSSKMWL